MHTLHTQVEGGHKNGEVLPPLWAMRHPKGETTRQEYSATGSWKNVYLDYNATTPLDDEVLESITHALKSAWGNPSSSYQQGIDAKELVKEARCNVAEMIGAKPSGLNLLLIIIFFQSNNVILHTAVKHFHTSQMKSSNGIGYHGNGENGDVLPHFITTNLEHDAVKLVLEHFADEGIASVTFVPASPKTGCVAVDDVIAAVRPSTCMVSIMLANNETGVIQPVKEIFDKVAALNKTRRCEPRILLHTDAAQAIGKIDVNVQDLSTDYLTIVGHKFYGPRIGAIYCRDLGSKDVPLYPMFFGGGQERNYRPGTENTGMIAGLGKQGFNFSIQASELIVHNIDKYGQHLKLVRDYLEQKLQDTFHDRVHFNGKLQGSERLPNTCNVSFIGSGLEGHKILSKCKHLQASVGAACHSQNRASPILLAIGIPESIAKNAVRLSVGRETTLSDIDLVVQDLKTTIGDLDTHIQEQQFSRDTDDLITLRNEDNVCGKLCEHLDHVFLHGLRHLHLGYWKAVSEFTRKDAVKEIKTLRNVTTDLGRSRAWLFLALNECCLESYIRCYEDNKKVVKKYYSTDALLLDQQSMNIILTLTAGLEHVIFQLDLDMPYLDIGTIAPESRSRTNSEVDDDRLSLCSMDSIAPSSHILCKQSCSTPCDSLHSTSDTSETTSITSSDNLQYSSSHGNTESKIDRVESLVQDDLENEDDLESDVMVIRVKGHSKGKTGKKKFRKSGRERKSPVIVNHIKEENEDENVDVNLEDVKNEIMQSNLKSNKLDNDLKLSDILQDVLTSPKKPQSAQKTENTDTVDGKYGDLERTESEILNHRTNSLEDEISKEEQKEDTFDMYSSSKYTNQDSIEGDSFESTKHENSDVDLYSSVHDIQSASNTQGTIVTRESNSIGDVQLTVTMEDTPQQLEDFIDGFNKTEQDKHMVDDKASCDTLPSLRHSKSADDFKDDKFKGNDVECDQNEETVEEDDIYSSNQKSFTSTMQSMADQIINQPDAVLHQHMFEEEPEETELGENEDIDKDRCPGELELDNNTKLHLMLDVFNNSEEQFIKMYATRVAHTDGDPQPVFVLISDLSLYLLSQNQGDHSFIKDNVIPLSSIDYISLTVDHQAVHIVCTKRRNQYWLTTGSAEVSNSISESIQSAVHDSSNHKIPILNDATTQKIAHRKYLAKECRCDEMEVEMSCYSLVFWDDPSRGSNLDTAFREGHLLYKVQSPTPSGLGSQLLHTVQDPMSLLYGQNWKSAYVVLKDGLLCLYNTKTDSKPFLFVQMGGEDCVGCRRLTSADRDNCLQVIKADNSTVQMALATELEANEWLQSLCQAVAEGLQNKSDSKPSCLPCCCILTPDKILMCHEDLQTSFLRTLGSANIIEVTTVYIDTKDDTYCVLEFESHDSSVSTEQWVLYFNSKSERERYEQALSRVWAVHFEVDVPVIPLDDFSLQRKCRETAQHLKASLQIRK
ncbi:hypothetical protein FSP39_003649 [Pinctada imbricata]|uniref:Selenocysteine lyase n=1 Tax=Pinctada imbricata TaxID=66713 RepID=A0AA89C8M7_PINIB|nr:hypothetical protein FSP39_003649 [Pinctada imbricata]